MVENQKIEDSVFISFVTQKKVARYLTSINFDVRKWKALIAIAENPNSNYREISKESGVSSGCAYSCVLSLTEEKEKYPIYPVATRKPVADDLSKMQFCINDNGIEVLTHLAELFNKTAVLDSDVKFIVSNQDCWQVDNNTITSVIFGIDDQKNKKEIDKLCQFLPEFKYPLECSITNTLNQKLIVDVYIDQEEKIWGMRDYRDEKKYTLLGDSIEVDGDRLFSFFKNFESRLSSKKS